MSLELSTAVARLDAWFDTMRAPLGYSGMVVHWWQNCLQFTGEGFDWRYEGIILGYLNLYRLTKDRVWLDKAKRAGSDLVQGQMPNGNFRNSCFELNPYPAGTPGEAACSFALLSLAEILKAEGDSAAEPYQETAERNLRQFFLDRMWDAENKHFRDTPNVPSFVPNKAATLCEALFKWSTLTGDAQYIDAYALPTLDYVIAHQLESGAIYQNRLHGTVIPRFMPYYIARAVPALLLAYQYTQREAYVEAALKAMRFVFQWRDEDGAFVQVIYPQDQANRSPRWIAAIGDILRAADMMKPFGFTADLAASERWLFDGQNPNGGVRTAAGFGQQITQRKSSSLPDFRDVLSVSGWADKTFRYWTGKLPEGISLPTAQAASFECDCLVRGKPAHFREDETRVEIVRGQQILYQWHKGESWARICDRELLWK